MSCKISRKMGDILKRGRDNDGIDRDEALVLTQFELYLLETYNRSL